MLDYSYFSNSNMITFKFTSYSDVIGFIVYHKPDQFQVTPQENLEEKHNGNWWLSTPIGDKFVTRDTPKTYA